MKKYQVFVSSTFIDLREIRTAVIRTLLELDCIPTAMESFPVLGDSSFDYIKNAIDESDYFLLIVGDKYGSIVGKSGKSFIELEYEYANEIGKPILVFINGDKNKSYSSAASDDEKISKLTEFREHLLRSHLCQFFQNASELSFKLKSGITYLNQNHPSGGWIKVNDPVKQQANSNDLERNNAELKEEMYRLHKKIDDLLFLQKSKDEPDRIIGDQVRIFIGSSIEGLEVARCIQAEMEYDYDVEIWNQGTVFGLGIATLEALEKAVQSYDIGVFVFTPDDELVSRGKIKPIARDNVVFELGLFIGKLSRFRAFIIKPSGSLITLPTDLNGITTATYDTTKHNLRAALGPACHAIRDAIRRIKNS